MTQTYKCKYLTGRKLKVFLAIADRIVPPDADSPGGGTMATAGVADWGLSRLPEQLRRQILMLIIIIEIMGIFFGGRLFTSNKAAAKDRQLRFLENAPIPQLRMGFFGLKSYVCMGYYTREDVWKTIGYEGPTMPEREFADPVIRGITQGKIEVIA